MANRRFTRKQDPVRRFLSTVFSRRMIPRLLFIGGVIFVAGAATVLWWSRDLPDPQNIRDGRLEESTKIFDSTGQHLLYEIGETRRTYVTIDQVSNYIIQATIAAEDDQFYSHHGIDLTGLVRGVILKPLSGERAQGGSTITQQLIKNSLLTPERTIQRKAKEAVLALELEQRFTKDQILEMYLNAIPYGSRSYGIEAAAQVFFGISGKDLSLAQAATLAALPNAPSYYSPYGSHIEDLKARQEHILSRMAALGMISAEQADAAKSEELAFAPNNEAIQAPHFVFYVKEQLDQEYGERVVEQGGLNVTTTLNMELQIIAEEELKKAQEKLKGNGASNAALVAVDPQTGHILAMAGSLDYFNQEIDGNVNVAVRHRSPGSSIKPFIYAAAFEKGYTPETILIDAETDFGQGYKPKNYNLQERGPVSMRFALQNSLNIPAVKTLYLVGVDNAANIAQRMGMESLNNPDRYGLSLVLGGGEVRLLDITSAYGVFAAEGVKHTTRSILKVEDPKETLFDIGDVEENGEQVLDSQVTRTLTNVLSDNAARAATFGNNSFLQLGSRPVAAKTGTTQEYRDGWTVGYTPSIAAGVWVGNNDNSPMGKNADGSFTAAPIWNAFMRRALTGKPIEQFTAPTPATPPPHGVLRGEIKEVKGKWVPETQTLYALECPVAEGQPRTFKEIHNILYYVRRNNPQGQPPATAESDPQFTNWETGVEAWIAKNNEKNKDNPAEPLYGRSLPTPSCDIGNEEDLPKVRIVEPDSTIIKDSPTTVRAEIDTDRSLKEVRFILDGKEIARRGPDDPFVANITFEPTFSGRKTLLIQAITEDNLIGRAHRTFIINPDDSAPSITLHTPQDGIGFAESAFPQVVKVTATDSSGIESVDVLYRKEGQSGTSRIGRTTTQAPTAPNRYEVTWKESPGPGTYEVYAIAYDKTGNFTESKTHVITIE